MFDLNFLPVYPSRCQAAKHNLDNFKKYRVDGDLLLDRKTVPIYYFQITE